MNTPPKTSLHPRKPRKKRVKKGVGDGSVTQMTLRASANQHSASGGTLALISGIPEDSSKTLEDDPSISTTTSHAIDNDQSEIIPVSESGLDFTNDEDLTNLPCYRICLVGQESGKTSLAKKFIDFNDFVLVEDAGVFGIGEAPTVEEVYEKITMVNNKKSILSILDTSSGAGYEKSQKKWFNMVEGFILCYSICDKLSFENIKQSYAKIAKILKSKSFPCVVVGTKADDSSNRVVKDIQGKKFAQSISAPFFETSARTGVNVVECFQSCAELIQTAMITPSIDTKMTLSRRFKFKKKPNSRAVPAELLPQVDEESSKLEISSPTGVKRGNAVVKGKDGNMIWSPDSFKFIKKIGSGSYGSVHIAEWKATGAKFAIKIMNPEPSEEEEVINEYEILKLCRSPYITSYYGVVQKPPEIWIIMEHCNAGSIIQLMSGVQRCLSEMQIAYVMKSVVQGIIYLHEERNILHRDIKSANILLTDDAKVKIADFGVSRRFNNAANRFKTQSLIGTPHWMAPEVWESHEDAPTIGSSAEGGEGYSFPADIWSLGISAFEMAFGRPPNANLGPLKVCVRLARFGAPRLPMGQNLSKPFVNFVHSCLQMDPKRRPTARQLLESPFLRDAPGPEVLKSMLKQYFAIQEKKAKQNRRR